MMKNSKSMVLLAAVLVSGSMAAAQEKCEFALLGDAPSSMSESLKIAVGYEFNMVLNDYNVSLLDKAVNQNREITPESKENFLAITQVLSDHLDIKLKKTAESLLNRKLSTEQAIALQMARTVGRNENGVKESLPGYSGNYTEAQIARKDRILELAGFSMEERLSLQTGKLMDDVITKYNADNFLTDPFLKTPEQAVLMNQEVLREMSILSKERRANSKRKQALSKNEANALFNAVSKNPVARISRNYKYDPDSQLGFCFGRAMTAHLEALSQGVDKSAIRKVFVGGQMKAVGFDFNWQFHVATVVKNAEGGWWVIDPIFEAPISVEKWYSEMKKNDIDGKLRFYAAEPTRLGAVGNGKYQKFELMDDIYNGYFKELLQYYSLKTRNKLPAVSVWTKVLEWARDLVGWI
jgi:hypothetical protein